MYLYIAGLVDPSPRAESGPYLSHHRTALKPPGDILNPLVSLFYAGVEPTRHYSRRLAGTANHFYLAFPSMYLHSNIQ